MVLTWLSFESNPAGFIFLDEKIILFFMNIKIFLKRRQKSVFNFSPLITNNLIISYPEEIISSEIKHERTKMFIMTFFTTSNNKNYKQDMYKN